MNATYDVVVVGAGPYGLSTAAHLRGRGLQVGVFGKTFEMWRQHMPKGMVLRSQWWATNLSDPRGEYRIERFFAQSQHRAGYPMPIETFVEYGRWFQRHAVPEVDETYVTRIQRLGSRFQVTLADGRKVESRAVVMAIGLFYYANRPDFFGRVSPELVSHSSEHADFSRFQGREVIVIGGGQSAIEYAALLHEAGAAVRVVSRKRIQWWGPDRGKNRPMIERVRAPDASIAPGWKNWVLDHVPYLFYRFPQDWKDRYNSNYVSGANDWLRDRVIGKVTLHEGQTITTLEAGAGKLQATISDGTTVTADHLMLATGYQVNLSRLSMLDPALRAEIKSDAAIPLLNHWFESSVPGLYFVGITSLRAFGPLYRFVAGVGAAARRVASHVAQR